MARAKVFFVLFAALLCGTAWVAAQGYWLGIASRWFYVLFLFPNGMSPLRLHVLSELSTLLMQLFPSLVAAWLISLIRPKRWLLYSVVFVIPEVVLTFKFVIGFTPLSYWSSITRLSWFALGEALLLVQVPILLLLFYKLGDWWQRRTQSKSGSVPFRDGVG